MLRSAGKFARPPKVASRLRKIAGRVFTAFSAGAEANTSERMQGYTNAAILRAQQKKLAQTQKKLAEKMKRIGDQ